MALKNKPTKVLISPDDIDKICKEYNNKNLLNTIFWALIGVIIPSWLSFFITDFKDKIGAIVYITLLIVFTIATLVFFIIFLINRKSDKIAQQIKDKVEISHSALFIIAKIDTNIDGKRTIKILLQDKASWNCDFLPYVELDNTWEKDVNNEKLKIELSHKLNVRHQDLSIKYISDEDSYSIKVSIPEQSEKLFRYSFYNVHINDNVAFDVFENQKWLDIDELLNNTVMMRTNGDVIESILRLKSKITDSFSSNSTARKIKIIWNITNSCSFNCNICATKGHSCNELDFSKKNQILNSILTIKNSIGELNFAGGDPLANNDSKKIITYASNVLDDSKISITTTGKSVHGLNQQEKKLFLKNCVLTIDASSDEKDDIRQTDDYNTTNYRYALKHRNLFSKLRINVPILNSTITDDEIAKVSKKIAEIKPDEVSFIKLMPVGKQKYETYPQGYDAHRVISKIAENIPKDIRVHLHCALRCEVNRNANECTMLLKKLGIDSEGNVFACCWAGYLNCSLDDNPFFLGNLLKDDLKNIIQSNEAATIDESFKRNTCNIFEYYGNYSQNSTN